VFGDPLATTVGNPDRDPEEASFLTTGASDRSRILPVGHVDRGAAVRVVGARVATGRERRTYESGD